MGLRERCIRRREEKKIRAALGDQEQHRSRKWSRLIKIRAEIFAKLYNERQKPL